MRQKGIKYESLKAALVPSIERGDAVFFFDSNAIDEGDYGHACFGKLLPLLDAKSSHSILAGDLLGDDQRLIFEALKDRVQLVRDFQFIHGTWIYCIYVSNITRSAAERISSTLREFTAFFGFADVTYQSKLKILLSLYMVNVCIKQGRNVIVAHEDDRDNTENIDIRGLPYEEAGFRVLSLQERLYGLMLTYKIERPVMGGFASDTEFAINSISDTVLDIRDFEVVIEENKFNYLKREKRGSLEMAGLDQIDRSAVEDAIRQRIASSYIYCMEYLPEHSTMKFALVVEIEHLGMPVRLNVALEYLPHKKILRVITLY